MRNAMIAGDSSGKRQKVKMEVKRCLSTMD